MSFSSQLQLLSTTWSLIKNSPRVFAGRAYKRKPDKIFLSCAEPPCNNLCISFSRFSSSSSLSLPFYFFSSFFPRILPIFLSLFLPRYFHLLISLSPSRRSSILLSFSSFMARRWQVGLIIAQVFFKEWITRSIFTASFSLSSCLPSLSFPRFASRLRFLVHSRNKRDSEWKKQVVH